MKRSDADAHEIESPSGIDLHPEPPSAVRLSKRAGILALVVAFTVAASVGYGIVTRNGRSLQMGFQADDSKGLTAATDAGKVIAAQIPNRAAGTRSAADRLAAQPDDLQPPGRPAARSGDASSNRRTPSPAAYPPSVNPPQYREPTPEERRLALAYEREMQALESPTSSQATAGTGFARLTGSASADPAAGGSQLASLLRSLQGSASAAAGNSGYADQRASGRYNRGPDRQPNRGVRSPKHAGREGAISGAGSGWLH